MARDERGPLGERPLAPRRLLALAILTALAGCAGAPGYRSADVVRAAYRIEDPDERRQALREVQRADSLRAQRELSAEGETWLTAFVRRQALLHRTTRLREAAPVALAIPEALEVERTELVRCGAPRITSGVVVHGRHRTTGERWVYVFDGDGHLRRAYVLTSVPEAAGP